MPQYLQIPPEEDFGGLDVVSTPDSVRNMNSPDARNNDISTPGSESKRNGFEKKNTTAYTNVIYGMFQAEIKGIKYTAYVDSAGNLITT